MSLPCSVRPFQTCLERASLLSQGTLIMSVRNIFVCVCVRSCLDIRTVSVGKDIYVFADTPNSYLFLCLSILSVLSGSILSWQIIATFSIYHVFACFT